MKSQTFRSTVSCRNFNEEKGNHQWHIQYLTFPSAMHTYRENHCHRVLWHWSKQLQESHEASLPLELEVWTLNTSQILKGQELLILDDSLQYSIYAS